MDLSLSPDEWVVLRTTLGVATASVVVGLPIAVLLGWLLARVEFPGKTLLQTLLHLPLVLPPVVTGYLLLMAFSQHGPVGYWLLRLCGWQVAFHWTGAALAALVMSLPLMVRPIALAFSQVDPRLEQAARTLGAGRWQTLRSVTLPLAAPGFAVAAVLGFARSLGEFGATITLAANIPGETRTLASATYAYLQRPDGDAPALRLTLIAVLVALVALSLSGWLERRLERRG
jgi:molybdate transport system permease protein